MHLGGADARQFTGSELGVSKSTDAADLAPGHSGFAGCHGANFLEDIFGNKSVGATTRILLQIASGVKHLHSLRIVHRDLKPAVSDVVVLKQFLQSVSRIMLFLSRK